MAFPVDRFWKSIRFIPQLYRLILVCQVPKNNLVRQVYRYPTQLAKQLDTFTAQTNKQLDVFTSQLEKEREHADKQLHSVLDEMGRERESWREVRHAFRNSANEAEFAKALLAQRPPGDSGIIKRP
jgi:hypothetical protein